MSWFKVDDGFHGHPKANSAGLPALGLWMLCGSWCAAQLTDGFVPAFMVARLGGRHYRSHAEALVKAGLWVPGEHNGEEGWWFHEYLERNPSREQVLAAREAARERKARAREKNEKRKPRG